MMRTRAGSLADRAIGLVVPHPYLLYFGPLIPALWFALWRPVRTEPRGAIIATAILATLWYLAWIRTSWKRPVLNSTIAQGLFTVFGASLLGTLVTMDLTFALVCVPFMPRFFLTMPFGWSFVSVAIILVQEDIAFRSLMLRMPGALGMVLAIRLAVIAMLGIMLRRYALQAEAGRELTEQLALAERRAGQFEERQRLARDIHDTLAQGFAGIVVHLETAALERTSDPPAAARHEDAAITVARSSLEEARRMMGAMRPEALDGRDLAEALTRAAREWSERTTIECDTVVTGDVVALDREIDVALLRVAQEALTNVWKYAKASRVTITLTYLGDVVLLDVRDDGVGIPSASGLPDATRFGLAGMRARIESLGGTFAVESAAGEGTTISASVPAIPADTATWPAPPPSAS